jgi:hypothetical protein
VDSKEKAGTRGQILLLVEGTLLAIALVTPIMPSKAGSDRGLADLFLENPTYLEEVAVSFLGLHVLLMALGVVFGLYWRVQRARE